jgi:hypothetical protein
VLERAEHLPICSFANNCDRGDRQRLVRVSSILSTLLCPLGFVQDLLIGGRTARGVPTFTQTHH